MKPNYALKGCETVLYAIAMFFGAIVFMIVAVIDMFF